MPIVDHHQTPEVPWRPGYRKWDIAGAEQGVTSTLSINTAEPGAGAPLHTHTMDELIVIMEGALEVRIDGETYLVEKDHTIVVPPGPSTASASWETARPTCWSSSPPWTPTPRGIPTTWRAAVPPAQRAERPEHEGRKQIRMMQGKPEWTP